MANAATSPGSNLNNPVVINNRSSHTYPLNYSIMDTQRFGEIRPFHFEHIIPCDNVRFNSSHILRNYTLASPLLSKLRMNKDYFFVPMSVIMPRTWEYIIKNPSQGDDIVAEDVNCLFPLTKFCTSFKTTLTNLFTSMKGSDVNLSVLFRMISIGNMFFSADSLFCNFKEPLFNILRFIGFPSKPDTDDTKYPSEGNWDLFVKYVFDSNSSLALMKDYQNIWFYSESMKRDSSLGTPWLKIDNLTDATNIRILFEYMVRYPDFELYKANSNVDEQLYKVTASSLWIDNFNDIDVTLPDSGVFNGGVINIDSFIAFKCVVAQYYSSDYVDAIYSWQLYLDYINSLYLALDPDHFNTNEISFSYNGAKIFYDVFSGVFLSKFSSFFSFVTQTKSSLIYSLCCAMFGPDYSFKWRDYFTSAKPQPLAVGSSDYSVVGDKVNVVDLSESILVTRFRHFVNRIGNNADKYLDSMFGRNASDEKHNIRMLSSDSFYIGAQEVENTSNDNQGNIVTLLRSESGSRAYETSFDQHGILIGCCWFDCERAYRESVTKFAFHVDRFDMFNPMLQATGDKPVKIVERSLSSRDASQNFGYASNYIEYKSSFSHCCGAFNSQSSGLKSWAMLVDEELQKICSDYIRSHPSEFDRFYSSLTGIFPDYFHFILVHDNLCDVARKADNNPPLLF